MSAEYNCEGCGSPVVWMAPTPAALSCMCVICLWCCEHIDPCEIAEVRRRCEPGGVALAFMKRASRDTFRVCAQSAEDLAQRVESGELPIDAPTALRLLVHMFETSAERP